MTALLLALLFAPAARAESPEEPAPSSNPQPPPMVAGRWYGWQIMIADVGALGLIAGGIALTSNSSAFAFIPITGAVVYVADAPLIYVAHGDASRLPGSLFCRILFPLAGAGLFFGLGAIVDAANGSKGCSEGCAAIALMEIGFGIGVLVAMVYDWITAREPDRADLQTPAVRGVVWAPVVALGPTSQTVGVVLRF